MMGRKNRRDTGIAQSVSVAQIGRVHIHKSSDLHIRAEAKHGQVVVKGSSRPVEPEPSVIKGSGARALLLPQIPQAVNLGVVEEEQRVCRPVSVSIPYFMIQKDPPLGLDD